MHPPPPLPVDPNYALDTPTGACLVSTLPRLPYGFACSSYACVLTKHAPAGARPSSMLPLECTEHAFEFAEKAELRGASVKAIQADVQIRHASLPHCGFLRSASNNANGVQGGRRVLTHRHRGKGKWHANASTESTKSVSNMIEGRQLVYDSVPGRHITKILLCITFYYVYITYILPLNYPILPSYYPNITI